MQEVVEDLQFHALRKVRIESPAAPPSNVASAPRWIASSSAYGITVVVTADNRIYSCKSADIHSLDFYSVQQADVTAFPHRTIDYFDDKCQITAVDVNAEGRVIAFAVNSQNGPFVHLFDVGAFSTEYTQQPFPLASIRLTSDSTARLCAFEWNPELPEMFAASSTDKVLTTISYSPEQGSSFSLVGTAHMKDVVTCISWSPKGKQLVVGDAAGRMHQLKPELTSVRVVEPPSEIPQLPGPHRCVGLCWISTTEWLIAHASASNKANVSLLTIKKGQPPQWQPYGDVAFASALTTNPLPVVYRFVPIFDWQLVLISSSHSTEVAVIGHRGGNWVHFAMETYAIQLPVDRTKKDTYPLGISLDLSSTRNVKLPTDDSSAGLPPQPFVYSLTSDGHLLPYIAVSIDPRRPALTKSPRGIAPGEVRNGSAPPGYTPRPQVAQPKPAAAVAVVPAVIPQQAAPAVPTVPTPFTAISHAAAPIKPSVLQVSAAVPAVTVEDPSLEEERRRQAAEETVRKQLEELENGLKFRVNEYCNARNDFAQKVDLVRELRAQVDRLDAESNFDQLQEMEDVLQSVRVSLDDAFLTAEQLRESILNNTVHVKEIRIIYDETQRKKALNDDSESALTFNQAKKMEILEGKYLKTLEKFGKLESLSKELIADPQGRSPRRRPLRSKEVIPPEEQAKINQITKNIATTVTRLASRITLLQKEIKNLRVMDENTGVAKPNRKALDEAIIRSRHYNGAVDAVASQCTAMINRLMVVVDEPKKKRDSYLFKKVDSSEVRSQLRRFMTQHCSKPIPVHKVELVRLLPDTAAAPRTPKKDDLTKSVNDAAISARLQQVMTPPQKPRLISVATQSPSAWRQDELSSIFEPPSTMLDSTVAPNDSVFASTPKVVPTAKPAPATMTFNSATTPSSVLTPASTLPMASTPIGPQSGVAARTLFPFTTAASPVQPVPSIAPPTTVLPVPPLNVAPTLAEAAKRAVTAPAPSTAPTPVVNEPTISTKMLAAPAIHTHVAPIPSVPAADVTSTDAATTVTTTATTAPTPQASTTTTTAPVTETTSAEVPKSAFGTLFKPVTTTAPASTVTQATSPFGAFTPAPAATSAAANATTSGSAGTRPSFSFKPPAPAPVVGAAGGFAAPGAAAAPATTTTAALPSSFSFKPNGTSSFGATTGSVFPSATQQQSNQDEGMEDDTTAATAASFSFMGGGLGSAVPQGGVAKSPFGGLNLANRQPSSSSSWFTSTAKPAQHQPAAAAASSTSSTFGGSAFGGRPAFGSGPSFGSQSAFSGGSSTGSAFGGSPFTSANKSPFASASSSGSTFGGSGATSGGFSAFAAKSSAFGQLAQQASPQQSAFGGGAKPAFGSFGGGTGSAFGGGSSPSTFGGGTNKSSAFTTFRK